MVTDNELLNLLPLPHRPPSAALAAIMLPEAQRQMGIAEDAIQNGAIAFTLLSEGKDKYVFEGLLEVYGIQNKFKE